MTSEEKQLLIKDLCARLPYGVICTDLRHGDSKITEVNIEDGLVYCFDFDEYIKVENCHLYLRPMSSMTEEEIGEYRNLSDEVIGSYGPYHHEFIVHCVRLGIKPDNPHECVDNFLNMEAIDWLNAHQFDYRIDPSTGKTLIESGLALEAPEGMYKQ